VAEDSIAEDHTKALARRGIVITRPREQSRTLSELVRQRGGHPIVFPTLAIAETRDAEALGRLIDELDRFDIAIFISPTAVERAMHLIHNRRALPSRLVVAAIGRGSARELKRFGITEVVVPEGRFDSEALIALPALAGVAGKAVIIFRGEGGRELLGDTLKARGASVEYAECYRRIRPSGDVQVLLRAWARGEIDAIMVASGEALRNLNEIAGTLGRHWLRKTPLFVPHERIARLASELGIVDVVASEPGDAAMVEAMCKYFATKP
jgi:uroporphyrinogen-III synthase